MPAVTPAEGTRIDATICPMCGRSMVTGQSPAVRELVEAARQAQRRATDEIVRDSLRKAIAAVDRGQQP